jgi:phosphate transport system permease protein
MLLAGILIGMLLIPFITPMIADAIRNVPNSAREASLALGANRGYTLRKAILPMAKPGIATALVLATLKAIGDVVIVSFVAGWESTQIPNPVLDVLETGSSLSAQGAGLIANLRAGNSPSTPTAAAVGFMSALLLLVAAALLVLLMNYLKARWRRSLGA